MLTQNIAFAGNPAKAYKANRLPLILVKFVQTTDAFFYVYVFVFLM